VAGLLCREIPFSHTANEKLLYSLQGGVVFLQVPHDVVEDLLQWLGARLTLGGILCTVLNDLVARHTVLDVNIGTPCRKLNRVEAVDESIVSCSQQHRLSILHNEGCFRLQRLWVSQTGTSVGHHEYADSRLLSSGYGTGMWQ